MGSTSRQQQWLTFERFRRVFEILSTRNKNLRIFWNLFSGENFGSIVQEDATSGSRKRELVRRHLQQLQPEVTYILVILSHKTSMYNGVGQEKSILI